MPPRDDTFFRETTLRICGSLDIQQALEQTFAYLATRLPVDAIALGYADLSETSIQAVATAAWDDTRFIWPAGLEKIALPPRLVSAIKANDPEAPKITIINDPSDLGDEKWLSIFPGLRTDSAMFVDLGMSGRGVGMLLMSTQGLGQYRARHAELVQTVRKPFAVAMSNARRYRKLVRLMDRLTEDNRALAADMRRTVGGEVVGADFGLRAVMELVHRAAPSNSPTLLLGETGTGKEVIAHAIHGASRRAAGPMITMQCGAIPETLLDSELFGHERGAFTGASDRKRGRFERAHGGTLFLDEIGELSPEAQVKLLRVLQERRFERIGGTATIEVDVRVIAATHRDLEQMVHEGSFREDLWYRLNVLPIRIPPLRMRREDIPVLVQYFIEKKAGEMNLHRTPRVPNHEMERLRAYDWPGNVRELQNVVERALILSRGEQLTFPALAEPGIDRGRAGGGHPPLARHFASLDEAMAAHIRRVLDDVDWQVAGSGGAAEILKMNPSTLRFRMKKLGISRESPPS